MKPVSWISPGPAPLAAWTPDAAADAPGFPLAVLLPRALLVLFLLYVFVGTTPLDAGATAGRAEGGSLDRLAVLGMAGLAALSLALHARSGAAAFLRTRLLWLMVALVVGSAAWSAFPDITVRRASAMALVAFICFTLAASGITLVLVHRALVAVVGAAIAAGLLATLLRPDFAITPIGVRGFYQHKNVMGLVAMIATLVVVCRVFGLGPGRPLAKLAHAGAACLCLIALLLSQSKTSMAITAGLVGTIPLFLALRRAGGGRAGLWLLALAACAVPAAALLLALPSQSVGRFIGSEVDVTFTGRDEIWDLVLSDIAGRPWTGFGYGAYWDVAPEADPILRAAPGSWLRQAEIGVINQAHNGYLDIAVQLGLPVLALAVGLLARALLRAGSIFMRAGGTPAERWAALAFVLIFIAVAIHNLSETSLWARGQIPANLTLLLMFLSAAAPAARPAAESRPHRAAAWGPR